MILFSLSLLSLFLTAYSLQCYKCALQVHTRRINETVLPCTRFEENSKEFIVDCPYSTVCMKKTVTLTLSDGESVSTTMRDCAHQSYVLQEYKNEKWRTALVIDESRYQHSCLIEKQHHLITTRTEGCYCPENLCNSAPTLHIPAITTVIITALARHVRTLIY